MAEATLEVKIEQQGAVTIATLNGPVDSATHDEFKNALDPIFGKPAPHIVLDCSGLTYINSKGLALLAKYHRAAMLDRGWMSVCNVNRKIVRTIDLLGMGKILRCFNSRDEAIAAMPS